MKSIHLLDEDTINKIAAGEVVERPSSVVKELVENAIDARASAITIEIREGGITFIRVTDNGCGIDREDIESAFLSHATSKIESAMDLMTIASLGFRGEALSSIASVAQVELITKVHRELLGVRYCIDGGVRKNCEDIGCPDGTTIIVRNLFYNTPARRKFLKTPVTEAGYISELVGHLALSHPDISFKFIYHEQNRLHTSGNSNLRDIVYQIYGRDVAGQLLKVEADTGLCQVSGYIGKPILSRGNRAWENYFINGRYIKSNIITKAIEDAYKTFVMIHKYPFTAMHIQIDPSLIDVNVHPRKMEIRFNQNEAVYTQMYDLIRSVLEHRELIPAVSLDRRSQQAEQTDKASMPEPFELQRLAAMGGNNRSDAARQGMVREGREAYRMPGNGGTFASSAAAHPAVSVSGRTAGQPEADRTGVSKLPVGGPEAGRVGIPEPPAGQPEADRADISKPPAGQSEADRADLSEPPAGQLEADRVSVSEPPAGGPEADRTGVPEPPAGQPKPEAADTFQLKDVQQLKLFGDGESHLLDKKSRTRHRLIGQVFATYWMVEYDGKLFIIDQHAAHEKVLYERLMKDFSGKAMQRQMLSPPVILTLSMQEENIYRLYTDYFADLGFEIEVFGGREYAVRGVPLQLFGMDARDIFIEVLDSLSEESRRLDGSAITDHIATMACKAAVKGNDALSFEEADALIGQLLEAENPYTCPHGRPTIISLSKYELEKKFKRIQ